MCACAWTKRSARTARGVVSVVAGTSRRSSQNLIISLSLPVSRGQLMNNPNLATFVVDGRLCGRLLGTGSYGSVEEVS